MPNEESEVRSMIENGDETRALNLKLKESLEEDCDICGNPLKLCVCDCCD